MKRIVRIGLMGLVGIAALGHAASSYGQTVTNLQVVAIARLDNGTSTTNVANVVNTNALGSIGFAIGKWNQERTNALPPLPAVTNYSHFIMVAAQARVVQAQQEDDAETVRLLQERISVLTPAEKAAFKATLNAK